jgi:excisionase family DNA binding protein
MQQATTAQHPLAGKENLTLPQFIAAYSVPRSTFYDLVKRGHAPRVLRVGRRVLINRKAADEWVTRMEALAAGNVETSDLV